MKDLITGTRRRQDDNAFCGRPGTNDTTDIGLAPYLAYSQSLKAAHGTAPSGAAAATCARSLCRRVIAGGPPRACR
ncbi:hypothetical protein [Dyella sp. EPa41]|uniref:hypothetical protein n=1 Tax=Dyella sp. EPa41 TaxID=1561194 RepID=UPI0019168F09|nr:hypothetical protein [Dyella sp. EPa41]